MRNYYSRLSCAIAALAIGLLAIQPSGINAQQPEAMTTRTLETRNQVGKEKALLVAPPEDGGLRFNFRGVPLSTVLDYLSEAAGFVIVREASVEGNVDVMSRKSLNKQEAVALLNSVLNKKGYAAVQNERTLTIVTNEEARKRDIPVRMGRDPQQVQKTEEMVTQVIPVTHANVTQLIKDLEPLLPTYAVMTANESSSAIVLTATQTDIRRIMEIIQALDSTMSSISAIKVFKLQNADATEVAKMISDLFKNQNAVGSSGGGGRRGGFSPMMMFGGGGGGGSSSQGSTGQTVVQVVAVADTRTNSVVVGAPEEAMSTIEGLVQQVDSTEAEATEIRVFPLRYSDAGTMATTIEDVFNSDSQQSTAGNAQGGGGRASFFRRFMPPGMGGGDPSPDQSASAKKSKTKVNAVADARTNSVVVNADKSLMDQIAQMVEQLDMNPAKDRKVFVYPLKYADPEETAQLLQGMFGDSATQNRQRRSSNQRSNSNSNGSSNQRRNSNGGGSTPGGMNAGLDLGGGR